MKETIDNWLCTKHNYSAWSSAKTFSLFVTIPTTAAIHFGHFFDNLRWLEQQNARLVTFSIWDRVIVLYMGCGGGGLVTFILLLVSASVLAAVQGTHLTWFALMDPVEHTGKIYRNYNMMCWDCQEVNSLKLNKSSLCYMVGFTTWRPTPVVPRVGREPLLNAITLKIIHTQKGHLQTFIIKITY